LLPHDQQPTEPTRERRLFFEAIHSERGTREGLSDVVAMQRSTVLSGLYGKSGLSSGQDITHLVSSGRQSHRTTPLSTVAGFFDRAMKKPGRAHGTERPTRRCSFELIELVPGETPMLRSLTSAVLLALTAGPLSSDVHCGNAYTSFMDHIGRRASVMTPNGLATAHRKGLRILDACDSGHLDNAEQKFRDLE
jgi:hypothetical protein